MKVLVTGGAGYVGSILVPLLLERGYQVVVFDNFLWGVKPILHFASHKNLEIITGDIRDRKAVQALVPECDLIIHLAAIVGYPACAMDHHRAYSTNVDGTRNIIETIVDEKIIFASTGSTYGKVEGICTEQSPIDPLTLYGLTKWEAEKMVTARGGVALRFATAFGVAPRLRLDLLVNDFVYQAIHNKQIVLFEGHFKRSFLHVVDAAKSCVFAIDHYPQMQGEAFNVGEASMNYTKREVALKIRQYIEYYLHEADVGEDLDRRNYHVSYEKINALGFKTTISLDEGIVGLIKVLKHLKLTNEWRNA